MAPFLLHLLLKSVSKALSDKKWQVNRMIIPIKPRSYFEFYPRLKLLNCQLFQCIVLHLGFFTLLLLKFCFVEILQLTIKILFATFRLRFVHLLNVKLFSLLFIVTLLRNMSFNLLEFICYPVRQIVKLIVN